MSQREGSLEDPKADSSVSLLPHLEAKIRQTHSLARLLTKYAEQLFQEYVTAAAAAAASTGVFQAKVLGFRVCGLYREWVSRTEGDLSQLVPGGPA
ncbi:cardiotrophin-1 [Trichechus manatus latirostris]|uniref:Cardiotrophin-1 n=1 Tax=Trichechus manatus latirostris TaxID=127582 RepID=A0A2Y9E4E5_TRIMA|nr:cardiotrophin-1 [Trichechus manatus latirostris]